MTVTPDPNEPANPARVAFRVRYAGALPGGPTVIEDWYVLTPGRVEVTTFLPDFAGPVRRIVPLLADDGSTTSRLAASGDTVSVSQPGDRSQAQTFTAVGATSLTLSDDKYPNHNGWARLAVGTYPSGAGESGIVLRILGG